MTVAVAIWSLHLQPGKTTTILAESDLRITNAALGEEITDEKSRTSVKFTYDTPTQNDESDDAPPRTTTVLCSLSPGKIEQSVLDIVLEEDGEYTFELSGKNSVYLSGNYIDQMPLLHDQEPDDDDDEEDFDLRDVSSDVEIDPAELDIPSDEDEDMGDMETDGSRFEEVKEDPPKPPKRPRESDIADADRREALVNGDDKKAKKEEKKLKKKLKMEDGSAQPAGEDAPQTNGEAKKDKKKDKKDKKSDGVQQGVKTEGESPSKSKEGMKHLPNGLTVKDVKIGNGREVKKGDRVHMRYIGKFENDKIFDQNTKGKPFAFKVGAGEVIKGWDEGIPGMRAGGERLLIVPPEMGYGNRKIDGIPAGSTLKFEVKLLEIK